ncbi:hypothetical protein D9C73_002638 [Collichthys lucidus]|uniref:Uncharacterized protein n=1 Tax=Collichthys lucidus TaxID=240159 RepID=A0A4U5U6J6_COLLU|nr:hypothetical protein D9C73_002638 [Collichthys lucidus]
MGVMSEQKQPISHIGQRQTGKQTISKGPQAGVKPRLLQHGCSLSHRGALLNLPAVWEDADRERIRCHARTGAGQVG